MGILAFIFLLLVIRMCTYFRSLQLPTKFSKLQVVKTSSYSLQDSEAICI